MLHVEQMESLIQFLRIPRTLSDRLEKGNELERILLARLSQQPEDTDVFYKLILLNIEILEDQENAFRLLDEYYDRTLDGRSLLLLAHLQDDYRGGVEDRDVARLQQHPFTDATDVALSLMFQALYYKWEYKPYINNGIKEKVVSLLEQSLATDPALTIARMNLADFLREISIWKKAAASVGRITEDEPEAYTYNRFNIAEYFAFRVTKKEMERSEFDQLLFKAGGSVN